MTKISKKDFFKLCKGSKRTNVDIVESPCGRYESTVFSFLCADGSRISKIETRSLRPNGKTTYAFYKQGVRNG